MSHNRTNILLSILQTLNLITDVIKNIFQQQQQKSEKNSGV